MMKDILYICDICKLNCCYWQSWWTKILLDYWGLFRL